MDPLEKKRKVGPSLEDLSRPVAELSAEEKQAKVAREWEELRRANPQHRAAAAEGGAKREEWMTALPEGSRQDALQFFRGGKTSFSAKGAAGSEVGVGREKTSSFVAALSEHFFCFVKDWERVGGQAGRSALARAGGEAGARGGGAAAGPRQGDAGAAKSRRVQLARAPQEPAGAAL